MEAGVASPPANAAAEEVLRVIGVCPYESCPYRHLFRAGRLICVDQVGLARRVFARRLAFHTRPIHDAGMSVYKEDVIKFPHFLALVDHVGWYHFEDPDCFISGGPPRVTAFGWAPPAPPNRAGYSYNLQLLAPLERTVVSPLRFAMSELLRQAELRELDVFTQFHEPHQFEDLVLGCILYYVWMRA
jgi:hypothetical protein